MGRVKALVWAGLIGTVLIGQEMIFSWAPLVLEHKGKVKPLDLMPVWSEEQALAVLDAMGEQGRRIYMDMYNLNFQFGGDLSFPFFISLFRAALAYEMGSVLWFVPFIAMGADYLENACVFTILQHYDDLQKDPKHWSRLCFSLGGGIFTPLKFLMSVVNILDLFFAFISRSKPKPGEKKRLYWHPWVFLLFVTLFIWGDMLSHMLESQLLVGTDMKILDAELIWFHSDVVTMFKEFTPGQLAAYEKQYSGLMTGGDMSFPVVYGSALAAILLQLGSGFWFVPVLAGLCDMVENLSILAFLREPVENIINQKSSPMTQIGIIMTPGKQFFLVLTFVILFYELLFNKPSTPTRNKQKKE